MIILNKPQWYIAMQSFIKLAGRFNVRISTVKKLLFKFQNARSKSERISDLLKEIELKLLKKVNSNRSFVNIPKWERFINKCKTVLKDFKKKSPCVFVSFDTESLDGTIVKINKNIHLYVEDVPCKHKGKHFHIRHPDFNVEFSMDDLKNPRKGIIPFTYRKVIYDWIDDNEKYLRECVDNEFKKREINALSKKSKKNEAKKKKK